ALQPGRSVGRRWYTCVVLLELRIENLLLIERAELRPGPGLTAITGETGAGKTVLAHALDLLLGGKPRPGIVRPGAREAYVEGVFELPPGLLEEPELEELRERVGAGLEEGEAAAAGSAAAEIVLARRVGAGGRTRAFVQGRSATAADLQALGGRLLAFYGQHEHRRLTLASAQLELLDGFCGRDHLDTRDELGCVHAQARELERRLSELHERAGTRDRDLDLLAFEIEEIDSLGPTEEEKESLLAERERLRRMDGLLAAAGGGAEAIAPAAGEGGVGELLGEAERLAGAVQGVDPALDELAGRLAALRIEAEDVGGELRRYADSLEAEPGRLQEVEERLEAYERLERKHGGSVAAVVAHAERCRAQRDDLEQAEVATERAEGELAEALARRGDLARRLSEARADAAPRLAEQVREELAALAMEGASFEVRLEPRDEIGAVGAERVELMLAPNPGVPAAPIREAASGGELSRVMLALMTVAGAGESRSIVFDEVDAGVGGQTARAVGERLRALGETRQVLCITHLPQIAALATSHFRIEKSAADDTALTTVEEIAGDGVVEELVRMLGAGSSDGAARRHAEELLA
ncbi:MAG TPA: DNA repair protein RecN, partial [Thermoleophilaceae bacterium]|nr:DNA repair protein RecN [Thermoleophilaceae bacterium]